MRSWTLAIVGVVIAWTSGTHAQDVPAHAVGIVYDVASPEAVAAGTNRRPVSPEVQGAIDTLRSTKLLTPSRVGVPPPPRLLERWGDALLMGARAPQFASEIGAVRDAAVRAEPQAVHDAVTALYRKAGRAPPSADAMKQINDRISNALSTEPEATLRNVVTSPAGTVEITHARRAGEVTVEVTRNGSDGKPVRTVFRGDEKTVPTADGKDLQIVRVPSGVCTVNEQQSAEAQRTLNGIWKGSDGKQWEILGTGPQMQIVEARPDGFRLAYTGPYLLGKVTAFHAFASIQDIGDDLPASVRSQLVGRSPSVGFTVRLDLCGTELKGTWSSQEVTYSSANQTIRSIHDPYDIKLTLSRGNDEGTARGAADEEAP